MITEIEKLKIKLAKLEQNFFNLSYRLLQEQNKSSDKKCNFIYEKEFDSANTQFEISEIDKVNSVTISNISKENIEIKNFRINKKILPFQIDDLVNHIVKEEKEPEKQIKLIFKFVKNNLNWDYPDNLSDDFSEPLNILFSYGYGLCDDQVKCFVTLLSYLKIRTKIISLGPPGLHIVSQVYYNDKWHLFDPDGGGFFSEKAYNIAELRDNFTLVDEHYNIRYPIEKYKAQLAISKNIKEEEFNPDKVSRKKISIKLLPGMEFSYQLNPGIPFGIKGYRGFTPKNIYWGKYSNVMPVNEGRTLNFISPFPIIYAKFEVENNVIDYSLNNHTYRKQYLTSNCIELFTNTDEEYDSNAIFYNRNNKLNRIKINGSITKYEIYVQINAPIFPTPQKGINNCSFDCDNDLISLKIKIEGENNET